MMATEDRPLDHRVLADRHQVILTRHAVERYIERVKPMLDYEQALDELARLLKMADWGAPAPTWAQTRRDATGWVVIADSIAFPVVTNRLMTCLTRGEVGAELRLLRAGEPRGDRARRQRKRKKQHGKVARDERRRARAVREEALDG